MDKSSRSDIAKKGDGIILLNANTLKSDADKLSKGAAAYYYQHTISIQLHQNISTRALNICNYRCTKMQSKQ